eukprot:augustus_masked-scaffold_9-processed-gene-9.39-mRNA-1 protein AED:1.00 eAED:1.00 QI:0/-1/0/0/-1/1/1/0/525
MADFIYLRRLQNDDLNSTDDFEYEYSNFSGPTFAPTGSPTEAFNPLNLPGGYRELTFAGQLFTLYLTFFAFIIVVTLFMWKFYPLEADDRVNFFGLIAALFCVFIHIGDYYSNVLLSIQLIFAGDQIIVKEEDDIDVESFTRVVIAISISTIIISNIFISWRGKMNSELELQYFPVRLVMVCIGAYPLYLLMELVTANYYGGQRAKLQDIVMIKLTQGTVESLPQIALLLYLTLRNLEGLSEIVFISLSFSVASLVTGIVLWDLVREIYNREGYVEVENDVNYLFFDPYISSLYQLEIRAATRPESSNRHVSDYDKAEQNKLFFQTRAVAGFLFRNTVTRLLECFGRIGFFVSFALCTLGWGLIPWFIIEAMLQIRYHGITFFFSVWVELIFNLRDDGNYFVAVAEWKTKLFTTLFGYFIILMRLVRNPDLIDLDRNERKVMFLIGLCANLILFPWIRYLFSRQARITKELKNSNDYEGTDEVQEILEGRGNLNGFRSFGQAEEPANYGGFLGWMGSFVRRASVA